mgnify:CR=1 FL=1
MNTSTTPVSDAGSKLEDSPYCSASGRDQYNDLKLEINRLIWQYSPPETTLGMADLLACDILNSILAGKYLT